MQVAQPTRRIVVVIGRVTGLPQQSVVTIGWGAWSISWVEVVIWQIPWSI